ncbi:hypothetical protein HZZ13_10990 [Bradyrhizobium sp. CNPSo 4010]|uniref:Transposase n=1 Tax=Bradyrhizobium agreste TaxID=2751811 RepID=A0ABS0PM97_9BRAD|nr:hypothetical protein [Bradyrhizobium agreste]MBH5398313.1 hypothetical protein [Bradyrhizobium agreste]
MPVSKERTTLIRRPERATAGTRRLLAGSERWRRCAEWQLDAMFVDLSAEFGRPAARSN